jgi:hypothetical protein
MGFANLDLSRERRLLGAILAHWDVYAAEGQRYSDGGRPTAFWKQAIFLHAMLAKRGIGTPIDMERYGALAVFVDAHRGQLGDLLQTG